MNDNEIYEVMLENNFPINTINQVLKAKQKGYDIYNPDIHISNECLRNFRLFVMENLEPVFTREQLRQIQLGFIKGIDVLQYADENYSDKEMILLRKLLENKLDIELVKEYSSDYDTMAVYSKAIRNKLTREDFEDFDVEIINEINIYLKKNIDIRKYLKLGYNIEQSLEIATILKSSNLDISDYLSPLYNYTTFKEYTNIILKFKDKNINKIFNPNFNRFQLNVLYLIFTSHCNDVDDYIDILINPEYSTNKMHFLETAISQGIDKQSVKIIQESNLSDINFLYLKNYFSIGKLQFDERLFTRNLKREYLAGINYVKKINLDTFFNLVDKNINASFIPRMLELENQCISINDYVNEHTSHERFKMYDECMRFIKQNNLWADEKFLMELIDDKNKLETLKKCIKRNLDYRKINFDLYPEQINLILDEYSDKLEISFNITKSKNILQIKALLDAKVNNIKIDNLLIPNLEPFKYGFILQLEKYNLTHKRKININEIIRLDCDIKTMGPLISKLISDDLDKNLEAYKIMSSLNKIDIQITKQKER